MKSVWEVPFVVVDVETTGSDPAKNRIMDIACVTTVKGEIVSDFSSLINPHQFIPTFIQKMTGISNGMAFNAPELKNVINDIENTFSNPDTVFVAHNVKFDHSFVNHTFLRAGMQMPEIPKICTLKLARRLLPKELKKNVGSLAKYFNIPIVGRHRALGDAYATAGILIELLEIAEQEHNISNISELLSFQNKSASHYVVPARVSKRVEPALAQLPDEPGVYYFYGRNDEIIYVGKAKSLKDRVKSYFHVDSDSLPKNIELVKKIYRIEWECTGTELAALLLESKEIKKYKPQYNILQKVYRRYPFIRLTANEEFPRAELSYSVESDNAEYYGPFRSIKFVEDILQIIDKQFSLRKCDDHIEASEKNKPCFYYQIKRCKAPCSCIQTKEDYRNEVDRVRYYLSSFSDGIIDQLENRMATLAENLEFEKAAAIKNQLKELRKLFERTNNVPTSINKNNIILVLPVSSREKTVEVFLIKTGRLIHQEIIGRKAPLGKILHKVHDIYYNGFVMPLTITREDADELRIISSWTFKQQENARFLYIEGKTETEIKSELKETIRNICYKDSEPVLD